MPVNVSPPTPLADGLDQRWFDVMTKKPELLGPDVYLWTMQRDDVVICEGIAFGCRDHHEALAYARSQCGNEERGMIEYAVASVCNLAECDCFGKFGVISFVFSSDFGSVTEA